MRSGFRAWLIALAAFFTLGFAEGTFKKEIPLIIPGTGLGWGVDELRVVLAVEEAGTFEVQLYSPGFDPKDYRSPHELGDERYDGGKGELLAVYELRQGDRVIVRKTFGIEPHAWHRLYRGRLEPGEYVIAARFFGNGKNAVVFHLKEESGRARLLLAPGMMQTYNVVRGGWQTPFRLRVPEPAPGLRVGVYDGDGPRELEMRVSTPEGELTPPVPGNREWTYVATEAPGEYAFRFRIPEGARQHTNTIGLKVELGPIKVEIVDTQGRPVPEAGYRLKGAYRREVELRLPQGWRLVRTEVEGGRERAPGLVAFGMGAGRVRFVLEPVVEPGRLVLKAETACGTWREPFPLVVEVGDRLVRLGEAGQAEVVLDPGVYDLKVRPVPGARVEGAARVEVVSGRTAHAEFVLEPEIELSLALDPEEPVAGRPVKLVARARTDFPKAIPAELSLDLPEGWEARGPRAIRAPLGGGREAVLALEAVPNAEGEGRVVARLGPCGLSRALPVRVLPGLRFVLTKVAEPEVARPGETVAFRLEVRNTGGVPAEVVVRDPGAPGLVMEPFEARLNLAPGARWTKTLKARVAEQAEGQVENRAVLLVEGREVAEARARVRVVRPRLALFRTLEPAVLLPGEKLKTCLRVTNAGEASVRYTLIDRVPEWLTPEEEPRFEGELAPGESRAHCYRAEARFGPQTRGVLEAVLQGAGARLTDRAPVARELLGLWKEVAPSRVKVGTPATFQVRLKNPLDRPVRVRLVEAPDPALGVSGFTRELELPARGEERFALEAKPEKPGTFKNQASVFVGQVPAAKPAVATLEVLPELVARRVSTIELPFTVEAEGDGLLIRHALPEGARYRVGTSRLDGKPIPDPRVDDLGRLYWRIPFQKEGMLRYEADHAGSLGPLPEPELTLLVGDRELALRGSVRLADYRRAKPLAKPRREGLIRAPAPGTVFRERGAVHVRVVAPYGVPVELRVNDVPVPAEKLGEARYDKADQIAVLDYYAVPLKPGRNLIEVRAGDRYDRVEVFLAGRPERLVLVRERAVADGRSPLRFRIEARDAYGLTSGRGLVTLEAEPEPSQPDAAPLEPGYQVRMRAGVAELTLSPLASPGWVRVRAEFNGLTLDERVYVEGPDRPFYLAQGSITLHYGETFALGGLARGYAEAPLFGGRFQGALDLTVARGVVEPGLNEPEGPLDRFPITGSAGEAKQPLVSEDGVAFRYDHGNFSVGYGRLASGLGGLAGLPRRSALYVEGRGALEFQAFAGLWERDTLQERIEPDGSRVYYLSRAAKPGSERVVLVRAGERIPLQPLRDYVLDYPTGTLYLSHPLWPTTRDLVPQFLEVRYAPETAPRDQLAFGAGVGYRFGGFHLRFAAASLDRGQTWQGGVEAAYRDAGFGLALGYRFDEDGGAYYLRAQGTRSGVEAQVNLQYRSTLSGSARVAAKVGPGRAVLEHRGNATGNETDLLYELRFGGNLFAGLGAAYAWEEKALGVLGRLGYEDPGARFSISHMQPFGAEARTRLEAQKQLGANLVARGDLSYRWGVGILGSLGLDQKLGPANLSVTYQLPGASGEGNRARFGIRAPLPLSERWTLDLSAGYEHAFASGESLAGAGVGVRYRTEGFVADLGVEGATGSHGDKVSLRAGASGQIDPRQVLSFDANYQLVPEQKGRFTLAYAYRGRVFQVLTYHRLKHAEATTLEGEVFGAWHPSLRFQLRPSAAYRIFLDDPEGNVYQLGLGFNYYFTRSLGLGAGGYYVLQPGTETHVLAFSVEGSVRMLDPLWLNLGYTFGGFAGLTPEARPGVYLRLDFFGVQGEGVDW